MDFEWNVNKSTGGEERLEPLRSKIEIQSPPFKKTAEASAHDHQRVTQSCVDSVQASSAQRACRGVLPIDAADLCAHWSVLKSNAYLYR